MPSCKTRRSTLDSTSALRVCYPDWVVLVEDENTRCAGALDELVMVLGKLDWSATAIAMFSQLSTVMSFSNCSSIPSTPLSHTHADHTHTHRRSHAHVCTQTYTHPYRDTHTHIHNNTNAHTAEVNQPIAQLCCPCRPVPHAPRSAARTRTCRRRPHSLPPLQAAACCASESRLGPGKGNSPPQRLRTAVLVTPP